MITQSQPNPFDVKNRVTWPKAARYKQVTVVSEIFTLSWLENTQKKHYRQQDGIFLFVEGLEMLNDVEFSRF